MTDILRTIKHSAKGVQDSSKPCDIVYGKVVSVDPLKIYVDQKLTLEKEQLKLTRAVQDHEVDLIRGRRISYGLKGWDFPEEDKWRYKVKNRLEIDDKVVMIRAHGGQQYIVIDKEWVHDDTFTN
ncbi:MAG: DUF2577 domain-containing protein [Lysinibacillus sp.]|nr:DUF2577 domain-containing protein [Lysinibacillus sp.]